MGVNAQFQVVYSATGGTNLYGYDNEFGAQSIQQSNPFPANSNGAAFSLAFTLANAQAVYLQATQNCTIKTNGLNTADVQTITVTGTPTGGFFPIEFNGVLTSLNYNTNSSTAQTTLQALSSIGAGNVTCSGGPLPGTPIVCTFASALNAGKQPSFNVGSAQFTGGSSPTVSVAHTTPGQPSDTINLVAGIPRVWGASQGFGTNPFTSNVNGAFASCNAACLLSVGIVTT